MKTNWKLQGRCKQKEETRKIKLLILLYENNVCMFDGFHQR